MNSILQYLALNIPAVLMYHDGMPSRPVLTPADKRAKKGDAEEQLSSTGFGLCAPRSCLCPSEPYQEPFHLHITHAPGILSTIVETRRPGAPHRLVEPVDLTGALLQQLSMQRWSMTKLCDSMRYGNQSDGVRLRRIPSSRYLSSKYALLHPNSVRKPAHDGQSSGTLNFLENEANDEQAVAWIESVCRRRPACSSFFTMLPNSKIGAIAVYCRGHPDACDAGVGPVQAETKATFDMLNQTLSGPLLSKHGATCKGSF